MSEQATQDSTAWSNRFETPVMSALLDGLDEQSGPAFRAVLDELTERKGCRASVEWLGLPWRWTIVVSSSAAAQPALAYLVPSPSAPLMCVPTATGGDGSPDPETLTKPVRQALEQGGIVAGYIWAEWPISDVDLVAIKPLLDARAG